jgi:hypothetical protein
MRVMLSRTGKAHGWGSDPWKWVSGLTGDERRAVQDETAIVLVGGCPPDGGGNGLGTRVRQVLYARGRYIHRVPAEEVLLAARLRD